MNPDSQLIYKEGAGILPFAVDKNGNLYFLFQKSNEGKKAGLYTDFGGSAVSSENILLTAVREFCEETAGIVLSREDIPLTCKNIGEKEIQSSLNVKRAIDILYSDLSNKEIIKTICEKYTLFFIKIEYFDIKILNDYYFNNTEKKREFFWIGFDEILSEIFLNKLHPRLKNANKFQQIIQDIINNNSHN
jgi:8-oxo-dGTP pyrophosphatase MutT (NUDIX family)